MTAAGEILSGRFAIERRVGSGGMGTLYRAVDRSTSDVVVVKILGRETDEARERFAREAQALCALDHPAIVKYVAEGSTDQDEPFIVMEWLDGEDFAARLRRGILTIDELVQLGTRIASALAHVHARGIVHRDVKPSNIFIPGGRIEDAKLLDFGLARFLGAASRATQSGMLLGTVGYLAPEQARSSDETDHRVDIFALGCVLFEAICGRPAFEGENILAILSKIVFAETPRACQALPGISPALDELLARMMAKERSERPRDGEEVCQLLQEIAVTSEVSPLVVPTATSGERRLISIVLARPVDEAASAETVQMLRADDPEGPLEAVRRVVVSHNGRMERLADGSVVAVVRERGTATDQAARAARMALAMRIWLKGWALALATGLDDQAWGPPVGDVVDRAVRVLGRPGAILLDQLTAGLLDSRFDLHGSGAEIELGSERTRLPPARLLLGKPTPCVGRERERALLRGLFDQATAEWVARAVLVTGAAGSGKSRLREELLRDVEGLAWVLFAQGDDLRAGAPYAMLGPAIRAAIGIREGEPLMVRQHRLRTRVVRDLPTQEVQRVTEFLGELIGVPSPGEPSLPLQMARRDADLMGEQMLRAFVDLIAAAPDGAVLLVLEDLQWGDAPTVRFVDAALERLAHRPFMVLALARPAVREEFPELWRRRDLQHLALSPLSPRASERLVQAVLGQVSPERVRRIVDQSSGNAFFLEELIRAEAQGAGDALPPTVLAMVQSRLAGLPADILRTLCRASVFGRSFWAGGVEALGAVEPEGRFAGVLRDLVASELVQPRPQSRFAGESEYIFRHDLVREAAYEMLRAQDRQDAHLAAVEWLEASGEVDPVVLARHYERASRPERASQEYLEAARQSSLSNDLEEAIARADAGVRCGAQGAVLAELRLIQGEALLLNGEAVAGEARLVEASRLVADGGPLKQLVAAWLAAAYSKLARTDDAIRTARDLFDEPLPEEHVARIIRATRSVTVHLMQAGETAHGEALLTSLERSVAHQLDPGTALELDHAKASRAMARGEHATFLRTVESIRDAQEAAGDFRSAARSDVNMGFCLTEIGQQDRAESSIRKGMTVADRAGVQHVSGTSRQNLGLVLCRRGRFDEARTVLREAIEIFRAEQDRGNEASAHLYLAMVEATEGRLPLAEHEALAAIAGLGQFPPTRAVALAVLARVLVASARADDAIVLAREAMAILDAYGRIEEGESLIHLAMVEALEATGDREAAERALRRARTRLEARAAHIEDPEFRQSFLTLVPENAAVVDLARARLGAGPGR